MKTLVICVIVIVGNVHTTFSQEYLDNSVNVGGDNGVRGGGCFSLSNGDCFEGKTDGYQIHLRGISDWLVTQLQQVQMMQIYSGYGGEDTIDNFVSCLLQRLAANKLIKVQAPNSRTGMGRNIRFGKGNNAVVAYGNDNLGIVDDGQGQGDRRDGSKPGYENLPFEESNYGGNDFNPESGLISDNDMDKTSVVNGTISATTSPSNSELHTTIPHEIALDDEPDVSLVSNEVGGKDEGKTTTAPPVESEIGSRDGFGVPTTAAAMETTSQSSTISNHDESQDDETSIPTVRNAYSETESTTLNESLDHRVGEFETATGNSLSIDSSATTTIANQDDTEKTTQHLETGDSDIKARQDAVIISATESPGNGKDAESSTPQIDVVTTPVAQEDGAEPTTKVSVDFTENDSSTQVTDGSMVSMTQISETTTVQPESDLEFVSTTLQTSDNSTTTLAGDSLDEINGTTLPSSEITTVIMEGTTTSQPETTTIMTTESEPTTTVIPQLDLVYASATA